MLFLNPYASFCPENLSSEGARNFGINDFRRFRRENTHLKILLPFGHGGYSSMLNDRNEKLK